MANTEKNPKKEYKVVLTRSQRRKNVEKENRVGGVVEDVCDEEELGMLEMVLEERKEKKWRFSKAIWTTRLKTHK